MNTNNENTPQPGRDAMHNVSTTASDIFRPIRNGMLFALGFFGTTILGVAISGTIKTWTSGEVLKSADLNTTISSMKTAIESIPNWTKASNGTDAVYTAGNVGIGTSSPESILQVKWNNTANFATFGDTLRIAQNQNGSYWMGMGVAKSAADSNYIANAPNGAYGHSVMAFEYTGDIRFYNLSNRVNGTNLNPTLNNPLSMTPSGQVGINMTNPGQTLSVNGNAGNTTGVWVNNSDERLKKNIQPLGNYLDKLTELRPVTFEWKDPKKLNAKEGKHIGFIAQEVEKVFPYWVDTDKDGMKWLSMEGVNAAFVQSFKEVALRLRSGNDSVRTIAQKIESLEKEKAANEKKISALEADNKRLHELVETLNASVGTHGRASLRRLEDRLNALERMQMAAAQAATAKK